MNQNSAPAVVVPLDDDMATEPARTVGQMFADKVMVKALVAGIVGIVAFVFKITADSVLIDNITTVITLGSMMVAGFFAQWDARKRAQAQAEETRQVVYSPQTVADLVQSETPARDVDAVVIPAPQPPAS